LQELLTVPEVANELKLSKYTIREYIKSGKLKASKLGKGFRVKRGEMIDFVERSQYQPWEPPAQ